MVEVLRNGKWFVITGGFESSQRCLVFIENHLILVCLMFSGFTFEPTGAIVSFERLGIKLLLKVCKSAAGLTVTVETSPVFSELILLGDVTEVVTHVGSIMVDGGVGVFKVGDFNDVNKLSICSFCSFFSSLVFTQISSSKLPLSNPST